MTETYVPPVVPVRSTRTSQPQTPTGIDRSNPITRTLRAAILPGLNGGAEIISSTFPVKTGTNIAASSGVLGACARSVAEAASQNWAWTGEWARPAGDMTFVCISQLNATPTAFHRTAGNWVASTTNGFMFSPTTNFRAMYSSGGANYIVTGATVDTKPHVNVMRVGAGGLDMYIDGVRQGNAVIVNGIQQSPAAELELLGDRSTGVSPVESVFGVFIFHSALSDAEIASLSANPWQIFAPVKRRVFVPQVSGQTPSIAPKQPVTPRQTQMMGTAGVGVASVTPYTPRGSARSRQPQYPTGLNSALRTEFASCITLDKPVSVNSAIQASAGAQGRHYLFTGAANNTTYVDFGERATDIFTSAPGWAMFVFNPGPSGSWVTAYIASKSSANNTQGWNLYFTAAGALQMNLIASANMNWASSAGVLQSDTWHTIIISYSGDVTSASCLTIWVNGVKITPASSNGGSGHVTDLTFPLRLGTGLVGTGGMSFPLNGKLALSAFGRKGLIDSEALSLSANPWQIFAPENRKIWVPT